MKVSDIKTFLWLLFYQLLMKVIVYGIALFPALWLSVCTYESAIWHVLSILAGVLLFPVILVFQVAILMAILPKAASGKYPIGSKFYFRWLRRNIIAEYVTGSAMLNNTIQRISILKILYYGMLGYKNPASLILAPDVKLLDPDRCMFGSRIFIGYVSVLSGHTVKGNQLIIESTKIGDAVKIGSFCKLAVGVEVGENSYIDYGVEIGMKTRIGKNVKIFASVQLDDEVIVEDNVVIGKGVMIGRKTLIGAGSVIGGYSRIGSRINLQPGTKLNEMTDLKN